MSSPSSDIKKRASVVTGIVFVLLMIVPAVIGNIYYQTDRSLTAQILTRNQTLTDLGTLAIKIKLDRLTGIASEMAASDKLAADVAAGQWDAASAVTRDLQNNVSFYDPYIDRVIIIDASGTQRAAYPELTGGIGRSAASSSWYQALKTGGTVAISSVIKRSSTPQINVIAIAAPVKSSGGTVGYLVLQIPTDNFLEFGSSLSLGTYGFAYLVDQTGNVIAHPKYTSENGDVVNLSSVANVQKVITGQQGIDIETDQNDGVRSVVAYKPVQTYQWGVITQELYNEAFASENGLFFSLGLEVFIISLINLLVAYALFNILVSRWSKKIK